VGYELILNYDAFVNGDGPFLGHTWPCEGSGPTALPTYCLGPSEIEWSMETHTHVSPAV
jgi:hypothetical protein